MSFTAREILDDYTYGVNIAVVRARPGQVIVTRHKGFTAMEFFALPLTLTQDLQVGFAALTTRSVGKSVVDLSVEVPMLAAIGSGERLQALVTVVPEIAETISEWCRCEVSKLLNPIRDEWPEILSNLRTGTVLGAHAECVSVYHFVH